MSNRGAAKRLGAPGPHRSVEIPIAAAAALLIALSAGCGSTESASNGEEYRTVYVSAPLRGPSGEAGRAIVDGAKLALADAGGEAGGVEIRAIYLDDTSVTGKRARWDPVAAGANAREATEDASTIAYIGELESGATRTSLPITNQAGILHVSAGSTAVDLVEDRPGSAGLLYQQRGDRNFGRVIPDLEVQAAAARDWARDLGVGNVETTAGPGEIPDARYVTSSAQAPRQLPRAGHDFVAGYEDEHGRIPDPYAAYGYEAMAVVLDSIARASNPGDRAAVIDAFFATEDRDSVLGTYSIDELGNTTLDAVSGYVVKNGRLMFEAALEAP